MSRRDVSGEPVPVTGQLDADLPVVDRRGFLTAAGTASLSALLLSACGGGGGDPLSPGGGGTSGGGGGTYGGGDTGGSALPAGISRSGNTLRVDVAVVSALQVTNGFVIVADPATVIVNLGGNSFRAYTARCTHAGCLVSEVSGGRINCFCHGSAFDANGGQVLAGPATRPLNSFPVSYASDTRVLTVTTS